MLLLCCSQFPLLLRPFVFPGEPTEAYSEEGGDGCSMEDWQPLSLRSAGGKQAGGKAKRRLFATSSTLSKLTPLYFHPRSLPDRSRPERRCKNKRDVWISAHKRLTTHAPRVALFCLYLGIFPRPRFRVISRRQMASRAIGRQMTARTGGQSECEGAG